MADIQYGAPVTISNTVPYNSGYRFLYWRTTHIDGTEMTFEPGDTFTMPDNHVSLAAVWEAATSPVYYHANGASGGTREGGRYPTDSLVTVSGNMFTRPGYRFTGWSLSEAGAIAYQPGNTFTMPPRQVNLYAQWEQRLYTVTYIVSGGTGELDGSTPYAIFTGLTYGRCDAGTVRSGAGRLHLRRLDDDHTRDCAGWRHRDLRHNDGGRSADPRRFPRMQTPLAGGPVWALLNLILTIATALASILMLIGLIGKKREEEDGVIVCETKKHGLARVLTLVPGIGGIIAFILTENMRNPMVFTDRWTLLMVIIALIQLLLVVLGVKRDKDPRDDGTDARK